MTLKRTFLPLDPVYPRKHTFCTHTTRRACPVPSCRPRTQPAQTSLHMCTCVCPGSVVQSPRPFCPHNDSSHIRGDDTSLGIELGPAFPCTCHLILITTKCSRYCHSHLTDEIQANECTATQQLEHRVRAPSLWTCAEGTHMLAQEGPRQAGEPGGISP